MVIRSSGTYLVLMLAGLLAATTPAAAQDDVTCCLPDGTCEIVSFFECFSAGGIFLPEGTCDDCAFQTGACCIGSGCDLLNDAQLDGCFIIGGKFLGFGTNCTDCPDTCPADLTDDGAVGFGDLQMLLQAWGPCGAVCPADLTGDGAVGFGDLQMLLQAWGPCPL